jgi:photosystem II stability/assembly factor-like uncharacterized protein
MPRILQLAATVAGVVTLSSIACSGGLGPSSSTPVERPDRISPDPHSKVPGGPTLTPQQSGTTNRLQAVSPVNQRVVWASGVGGTFVVTTDGGKTWRAGVVPGAGGLEFRDVEGVSAKEAYLLSAGEGTSSRIYKTIDGGQTWTLQFQNTNPAAFYDCFDFWTPNRGLTFSDPVAGRFPVIRTTDGRNWEDIGDRLPPALSGEFGFAASGTCVATQGGKRAWIATGGASTARVLATTDGGDSWNAYPTPLVSSGSAGAFTIAFRDPFHGIVAGGDLDPANPRAPNRVAISNDGGQTWELVTPPPFDGAVFGLSYVPGFGRQTVVATGPGGAAWSRDEGLSWSSLSGVTNFWAVAFASHKSGWLVGTEGRILKISF